MEIEAKLRLCNVPGCFNRRAPQRLKCWSHIKRKRLHGTYEAGVSSHPLMKTITCVVEGCNNASHAKYLCNSHYQKAWRVNWWKTHERKKRRETKLEKAALIARNEFYGNVIVGGWMAVPETVKQDWLRVVQAVRSFYRRKRSHATLDTTGEISNSPSPTSHPSVVGQQTLAQRLR